MALNTGMIMANTGHLGQATQALTEQQKIARQCMEDLLGMLPPEYHDILHGILNAIRYQAQVNQPQAYAQTQATQYQWGLQNGLQQASWHQSWPTPTQSPPPPATQAPVTNTGIIGTFGKLLGVK